MKTVEFQGMTIKLDRPKGFVQKGKDKDGKPWERKYLVDYGYVPRTKGGDGDQLDVFLGGDKEADEAFWVEQHKDDGEFDEFKVMLGFPTKVAAVACYKQHIPAKYMGRVFTMKVGMMRSMLGVEPLTKQAAMLGFLEEMSCG